MLSNITTWAFFYLFAALLPLSIAAQTQPSQQQPNEQHGTVPEAQQPPLPNDATEYVRNVIHHELDMEAKDHTHWRYYAHREDEKQNYDRDIIETKDGDIGRTLLINGKPLTPDMRQKDEERMRKLVSDPDERAKRNKREKDDTEKATQMFKAIPDAFIFKYDGEENGLVRLSFFPNPNYDPPNRELRVFRALSGHMWINAAQRRLERIDGRLFDDVTFGWGLLGRLNKGGTFNVVRREVAPGHWEMVSLDVNMFGHAILFKNIAVREHQTQSDFRRMPDDITMAQAFEILQKDRGAVSANNQPTSQPRPHKQ
jgi:hypothetical protein